MATIKASFGSGGTNMTPGGASAQPSLATVLRDIADDLETLRAAVTDTSTKLNTFATAGTNYSLIAANGIKTKKG